MLTASKIRAAPVGKYSAKRASLSALASVGSSNTQSEIRLETWKTVLRRAEWYSEPAGIRDRGHEKHPHVMQSVSAAHRSGILVEDQEGDPGETRMSLDRLSRRRKTFVPKASGAWDQDPIETRFPNKVVGEARRAPIANFMRHLNSCA